MIGQAVTFAVLAGCVVNGVIALERKNISALCGWGVGFIEGFQVVLLKGWLI